MNEKKAIAGKFNQYQELAESYRFFRENPINTFIGFQLFRGCRQGMKKKAIEKEGYKIDS